MTLGECVWFAPLNESPVTPVSAWKPAEPTRAINEAASFTISLESVMVPKEHFGESMRDRLRSWLAGEKDLLISSTCQVAAQPAVQRVHYFGSAAGFERPFTSFVSDNIYVTQDFHPVARINVLFQLVEVDSGADDREKLLTALNGIASKVGAVYPAILPYAFIGSNVAGAMNKLTASLIPDKHSRLTHDINLFPSGRLDDIDLQVGRYILLDKDLDATQYQVLPDGGLASAETGARITDVPYLIFRIDTSALPSPDFVVNQRVATLLTQLSGGSNDPLTSSLGFLSGTLNAYTGFTDLARYGSLLQKQKSGQSLSPEEQAVMARIKGRADLKDYLPQ